MNNNEKIAVIGLGYVGLPLAVEFGKIQPCTGFDINKARIAELRSGYDATLEVDAKEMADASLLNYTSSPGDLDECNIYLVTVPSPVDAFTRPDLSPLIDASRMIGEHLSNGDIVIYESTVYPGATEEDLVPVLERSSGLTFNKDFFVGYSPERINPGDHERRLPDILKITSGSTDEIADRVDAIYRKIIRAGTYKASSIKVAEAAKVIENTQRDVNIALVNELSHICNLLDIDTLEVLEAAGTKWNFLPFKPGLVGGHCIGVDPYYLTHKAQALGFVPEVVLAGRKVNDSMAPHVANSLIRAMIKRDLKINNARVLIMGLAFKENCPDIRNTKVVDIIEELESFSVKVDVWDPLVSDGDREAATDVTFVTPKTGDYEAVILAVPHDEFVALPSDEIRALTKPDGLFFDLKGVFEPSHSDFRL